MAQPIYSADPAVPRVRCADCGETRIRAGMLAQHRATIGHPRPFDHARPAYRALLAAAVAARAEGR